MHGELPFLPLGSGLMSNIRSKVQQWERIVWDFFFPIFFLLLGGMLFLGFNPKGVGTASLLLEIKVNCRDESVFGFLDFSSLH